MKGFMILVTVCLTCTCTFAFATDKVERPEACRHCGMDRTMFAQSRMLIVYADGTTAGVCSIHCAATEMNGHSGKQIRSVWVADYTDAKKLVDAGTATWVIGGKIPGVMTSVPKWAFAKKRDAQAFIRKNGGREANFDEAMRMAKKEDGR